MKIRLFTIPNAITCLNLVSGCIAISMAYSGDFFLAFIFIILAAVLDFFDGFAARMLHSYSEVGKQLDSLADVVSFGVAPSAMLLALPAMGEIGWFKYAVFIMAAFSALRLAKFNIDERQSTEFIGLPTPANAILVSSVAYIAARGGNPAADWLAGNWVNIMIFMLLMSILLVSEIRMFSFKFKKFSFRDNELRYIFVLYTIAMLVLLRLDAVPLVMLTYILVSVVRHFVTGKSEKGGY